MTTARWPAAHRASRSTAHAANTPRATLSHTSRERSPPTRAPTPPQCWHASRVVDSQQPPLASTLAPQFAQPPWHPNSSHPIWSEPRPTSTRRAPTTNPRHLQNPQPAMQATPMAQPCNCATHPPQPRVPPPDSMYSPATSVYPQNVPIFFDAQIALCSLRPLARLVHPSPCVCGHVYRVQRSPWTACSSSRTTCRPLRPRMSTKKHKYACAFRAPLEHDVGPTTPPPRVYSPLATRIAPGPRATTELPVSLQRTPQPPMTLSRPAATSHAHHAWPREPTSRAEPWATTRAACATLSL